MAKVKILKPVTLGGKLHHKIGAVVEVSDKEAKILLEDGWAEKSSPSTPVTPGASVTAPPRPVNPRQEAEAAAKAAAKEDETKE